MATEPTQELNSTTEQNLESKMTAAKSENAMADHYAGMTEDTYFKSPLVPESFRPPYNPDLLWQKHGSYKAYEEMCNDDQVSICLQLKKDLILGDGAHVSSTEDGQEEIVEDLTKALFEEYEGDFVDDLEEILTSIEFGFSLTEKVFKLRGDGLLGVKQLLTRHPNSWKLHQDDKGRVSAYEQVTVQGDKKINPKALIHYINKKQFQNPYGNSDLKKCYNAWFAKVNVVKFMAIYLEKAAGPIPVGRYNQNAPAGFADKLLKILKNFQAKTAITIPKDVEVTFLEAKNNAGDAYIKATNFFNMSIGRSLFTPDLMGFTGGETGGGSQALGKEQMSVFFKHITRQRNRLEAIVNLHFIKPLVIYNHGFQERYPIFKFKPLDDNAAVELAKVWLSAVNGKTFQANDEEINHFRKLVKFPEGDVERVVPAPNPLLGGMPGQEDDEDSEGEDKPLNAKNGDDGKADDKAPGNKADDKDDESKQKNFGKVFKLPPGSYHKKTNFKAIATKLNDYDNSVMADTTRIVNKIIDDVLDQVEKKKIIQGQKIERIESISLRYKKDLKQVLKNSFTQLFTDSKSQASLELLNAKYAKPLASEKFLSTIEAETFAYVGDYEYAILKEVRIELIKAVKDGTPLSQVRGVLSDQLRNLSDVSIKRFARTKHTEVMNNGRLEFFESTGVVAAYQYSAVLDDTTSEICSGLDGKIFLAGEEPVPPLHFNCRSLLVPITKYEDFTPTESIKGMSPKEFIDENKGQGFSTN